MGVWSNRGNLLTASAVAAITLWASAASSTNYPLYQQHFDLAPWVPTAIFAVYPLTLIPMLLVFGNLSDYIGRRASMLIGLAVISLGALLLALAPVLAVIFIGRVLLGVGVALALSPATAAIAEFSGVNGSRIAGSVTAAATAAGLALATLIGGALVQYGPAPMYLDHYVLLAVTLAVLIAVYFLPRHSPEQARGRWRPRTLFIPVSGRRRFLAGVLTVSGAYALGAIFVGLGAQLSRALLHSDNALIGGAVISVSAIAIGVVAMVTRGLAPGIAVTVGTVLVAVGMATLILAGAEHSLALFIVASLVGGSGYSLLFSGGLTLVSSAAPAHHRAAAVSTAYVAAYLVQAVTALTLGALATAHGFELAVAVGAAIVVALAALGALMLIASARSIARAAI